jgi:predicted kinase
MARLILLCGLPGSGKSTYVANFMANTDAPVLVLSSDALLEEMAAEHGLTYQEAYAQWAPKAQAEVLSMAEFAISEGVDVVWDQTNLTQAQRAERAAPFFAADYEVIAVAFEAPQAVLKARIAERAAAQGKTIPSSALETMGQTYRRPDENEGFDHIVLVTPQGAQKIY